MEANAGNGGLCISDAEAQFFLDNGYLVIRNVVAGDELQRLRASMDALMEWGVSEMPGGRDCLYHPGHLTGELVLQRIEYPVDKTYEGKVLMGHPYILRTVEKLVGSDFLPTWDSMVLKMPGQGIKVAWHRDGGSDCVGDVPIFNVDFYLDHADQDTCLWVHPGSQKWSRERAEQIIADPGFSKTGAVPVPMSPGDVILHNILVLHGSPANESDKLRRVLYYEFRAAHVEREFGPHNDEYIPLKQRVLLKCLEVRRECEYIADPEPYTYSPPEEFAVEWTPGEELETYRYAHEDFQRVVSPV